MNSYRSLGYTTFAAAFALFSLPSHAVLITDSNPYAFSWSYNSGADGILSGNGSLAVSGFNTNQLTVAITLFNTSSEASDRLTAFGFGIDPNATSVGFADVADGGISSGGLSFIPSLGNIEVCAYGGSNCRGGSNGGILGGASDAFSLLLGTSGLWGSSVNIDPIGFKYQTGGESYEFTAPPTAVPEPTLLSMLAAGFLAVGLARRRRRAA